MLTIIEVLTSRCNLIILSSWEQLATFTIGELVWLTRSQFNTVDGDF